MRDMFARFAEVCKCAVYQTGYLSAPPLPPHRPTGRETPGPYYVSPMYYPEMSGPVVMQHIPGYVQQRGYVAPGDYVDTRRFDAPARC